MEKISLSQNPESNNIILFHPAVNNGMIKVLSIEGKCLATDSLQAGSTSTSINTGILSNGTYLLVYQTPSDGQLIKFSKPKIQ